MKHLKKFNESNDGEQEEEGNPFSLYDALMKFHDDNDVHHSCHTTLGNFVSFIEDTYYVTLNSKADVRDDSEEVGVEYSESKVNEEFDRDGYKSHWSKFTQWLSDKDFELYDGGADLESKFLAVANDDDLGVEEKVDQITEYLEDKFGLYGGYRDTWEYLDKLFMDEV